jgi:hypothetical protein
MLVVATTAAFLDQPLTGQEIPRRADRRQTHRRVPPAEPVQELVRPPARVLPTGLADQRCHRVGDFVRTSLRCPAAIAKSVTAALVESVQPLVARFPTDPVPRTQLGHGVQGRLMIANEPFSLFHRCRLQPGHRSTSQSIPSVAVSPMFPVCSVTYVPGLYLTEGHTATGAIASLLRTLRSLRPQACMETPRARTGRPRRHASRTRRRIGWRRA